MTRFAVVALLGHLGDLTEASQSQVPARVGDCVEATTHLEFFYKNEGEYERTHKIKKGQKGVLLNVNCAPGEVSHVEWLDHTTRVPVVNGAVQVHQFARVPWVQGEIRGTSLADKCLTIDDKKDGYQPVVKMSACADAADNSDANLRLKWKQQFSFNDDACGARPIRWTYDPSKCIDAVHPDKVLLTDCSGVDSQKFLFKCKGANCYVLAMGGRSDMCLFHSDTPDADVQLRSCSRSELPATIGFSQHERLLDNLNQLTV